MTRPPLSVTIITLNEEKNIARAVKSVQWCDEVVVVDSGSTDRTVEIAKHLGARVVHNPWPGYGKQKNFAQEQARHDWVLNLDADEEVSQSLAEEIVKALEAVGNGSSQAHGYYFPRKTFYLGRWIKHGGWYPNHLTRLANRKHATWTEPTVHEQLVVQGEVRALAEPLDHHAFSSIQEQILTNLNYSTLGSEVLRRNGQDASVARMVFKPLGKFFETYFLKAGFLDGLPGFIISINAAHSIFLKYANLSESRIRNENPDRR